MLAEIILLRLDIILRLAAHAGVVAAPRFVPLVPGMKLQFKKKPAAV